MTDRRCVSTDERCTGQVRLLALRKEVLDVERGEFVIPGPDAAAAGGALPHAHVRQLLLLDFTAVVQPRGREGGHRLCGRPEGTALGRWKREEEDLREQRMRVRGTAV